MLCAECEYLREVLHDAVKGYLDAQRASAAAPMGSALYAQAKTARAAADAAWHQAQQELAIHEKTHVKTWAGISRYAAQKERFDTHIWMPYSTRVGAGRTEGPILTSKEIRKLNFGRANKPVLAILRRRSKSRTAKRKRGRPKAAWGPARLHARAIAKGAIGALGIGRGRLAPLLASRKRVLKGSPVLRMTVYRL
jgi:hypothetical protein